MRPIFYSVTNHSNCSKSSYYACLTTKIILVEQLTGGVEHSYIINEPIVGQCIGDPFYLADGMMVGC